MLRGQVRVARSTGRIHPLVAAFPFDQLDLMEAHLASGDRSVIGFLRSVPVLSPIDVDAVALTDVNSPQDLEDLTGST